MMPNHYYQLATYAALALTSQLMACALYAPMHAATPAIRARGEAEITGLLHLNSRLEGAVTYSPLNHLLVRAAGSLRSDAADTTYLRVRQYEAAVGGYWTLSERWVAGTLVGYGQGHNERGFRQAYLLGPASADQFSQYDFRYHKVFVEAYALYQHKASVGMALRLTNVFIDELRNRGTNVGPGGSLLRLEPLAIGRTGPFHGPFSYLQGQVAAGFSLPLDSYKYNDVDTRNVRQGNVLVSLGLVFYPHRLFGKGQAQF